MSDPNPVSDRAAYIDKQVDSIASSKAPPAPKQPAQVTPNVHPAANKAFDERSARIYGTQK